jgi:hypothetical protein
MYQPAQLSHVVVDVGCLFRRLSPTVIQSGDASLSLGAGVWFNLLYTLALA